MQVARNVSRARANITNEAVARDAGDKSIQKLSIKWFVLQFVVDVPNVLVSYEIVPV